MKLLVIIGLLVMTLGYLLYSINFLLSIVMYCFGLGLTLASILKSRIILTHEERSKVVEKSVYTSKQIKLRPMRKLVEFEEE